mmetsp:Transcript_20051/g.31413  ORF Transcript_20051/g.31413 Transcript_20051/m.31413 type:complete len:209 (-) Transcript_20051:310-936(-)
MENSLGTLSRVMNQIVEIFSSVFTGFFRIKIFVNLIQFSRKGFTNSVFIHRLVEHVCFHKSRKNSTHIDLKWVHFSSQQISKGRQPSLCSLIRSMKTKRHNFTQGTHKNNPSLAMTEKREEGMGEENRSPKIDIDNFFNFVRGKRFHRSTLDHSSIMNNTMKCNLFGNIHGINSLISSVDIIMFCHIQMKGSDSILFIISHLVMIFSH